MTHADDAPRVEWFSQTDIAAAAAYSTEIHAVERDVFTGARIPSGKSDTSTLDFAQCHARLRQIGFSTLGYGAYEMIGRRILCAHLLRDLAPPTFMQPYIEGMLYENDPRFAQVRQSGFPVAWRLDDIEGVAHASGDRKVLALAGHLRAHAMKSGVIFSLSAPRLDLRVAVNLTSESHGTEWIDDRVIGGALSVSLAVHRVALPFLEARVARMRGFALGDEQQQVLERLVHGLSDQEIASALRTSLHKVGHHIRSLEKLFNVRNRAQLAYLAGRRLES
ncbi:LuxR family transcriptional regulator [Burkholderia vietnamiensis]|uniref:Autoinducer binding domain-containing protein n=1 Tax=Burkholderia vietnamiensis TaxID=60552 RepID=A0AAW7T7F5_BURVI|nr:autoinducer binding domain-containing protein [Burkholderia vietnamiensis]KKI39662.1 LuxR family transcriptional regulator [Burkholderia vietnamiensis]MDN7797761.1 autoinducer binding domain-containing protein [Burkholderia vietnamiensis]MDN8037231.1 autoinducer binding domain-containing protein [Burkholderia vietnamiensis]HDR8962658.1 autoinducer binding domain-containing protein [Burkholderia vietnamiensis]HDR9191410.1 autoinducer binding domain-containing protein [Burkholderia vietnamien